MICIRYLLFIPHWFTNVASPLIGVPFFLFLWTTMLSSIPGTALYTCAGAGLATVFEARERAAAAGEAAGEMPAPSSKRDCGSGLKQGIRLTKANTTLGGQL